MILILDKLRIGLFCLLEILQILEKFADAQKRGKIREKQAINLYTSLSLSLLIYVISLSLSFINPSLSLLFINPSLSLSFINPSLSLSFINPSLSLSFINPSLSLSFINPSLSFSLKPFSHLQMTEKE